MEESVVNEEIIINERKEKVFGFLKKHQNWLIYLALFVIIILGGVYLRTLNVSQLKDVTTNSWTLAPDLDPFLFLRWAKEIAANGSLPAVDMMRYVPLGFQTSHELVLNSYIIADFYKIMHMFSSNATVELAAIFYPVIFFCAFLIAFFLFVKKVFSNYKNANLIALISTALISVIPGFIHRTVAGVPEKESAGIFFMFLAFYFIASAFKEEKTKKAVLFGALAGISTGLMGLIWGGVTFLFVAIALAMLLIAFFSDIKKKDIIAYAFWVIGFTAMLLLFTSRYGLGLFTSVTSGFAYFVLGFLIFDWIIFETKLKTKMEKIKLPRKLISLVIFVAIIFIFILILEPSFLSHMASDIVSYIFKPFEADRLTVTVAENSMSYFDSWKGGFGLPFFWIFILGSVLLVYEMFGKLNLTKRLTIAGLYLAFILGMIFSKYSASSIMNGTNIQSIIVLSASTLLFIIGIFSVYLKEKDINLDKNLLLIFVIFIFAVFSARASIRLFYFIYPIAPIMAALIMVRIPEIALKTKGDLEKIVFLAVAAVIIIASISSAYGFVNSGVNEVKYASITGHYQAQWQKAMAWVRENTSQDAVFAHWWDYGYWVQTMGERATVLDGGNVIGYWDHLMGRHVLTAVNETEALEFLKTHKATHLLIDSSDIGKYTAYSSIGADENYDRYSWISTFTLDEQQSQEKRNETIYVFRGGSMLDKDLIWEGKIYPEGEAGIGAVLLPLKKVENENYSRSLEQPSIILIYQSKQIEIPIKCAYIDGQKIDFDSGINGCFYIIPEISQGKVIKLGAGFWLSEKLMNSLMVKLYILNESKNFEIAHTENEPIINDLNSNYNLHLPEIIFYDQAGGVLGPIKIWKINYPKGIEENPAYLETDYPNKALSEVKK